MPRKQTGIWRAKDGQKYRICDMRDSHLVGAIALLLDRARHEKAHRATNALASIGVLSAYALEDGRGKELRAFADRMTESSAYEYADTHYKPFAKLVLEARRRGLEVAAGLSVPVAKNSATCLCPRCHGCAVPAGKHWRCLNCDHSFDAEDETCSNAP